MLLNQNQSTAIFNFFSNAFDEIFNITYNGDILLIFTEFCEPELVRKENDCFNENVKK